MDNNTQQEIAKGLQEGSRRAWLQLYDAYAQAVWRNVSRLVGSDSGPVADIVQETFLAAARSARHFKPHRGSLWVWLWTIARCQVALYYRKQKRNLVLNQAQDWWVGLDGEKSDWIDAKADMPPDVLQSQELAALVRRALSKLPPEYQTLLLAKYVDGQPGSGIAELMSCSETAARSKLARARRAFRKAFKKVTGSKSGAWEVSL
jgi:RNA polymerase sigma-70 factor (ECF subfamily)